MIHEWRSYRLKTGAATEYLSLLYDRGLPFVTRHLPLMGYWLAESGPLNVIHHLWSYADWAEREESRARLAGQEEWTRDFMPAAFALVEEQANTFLRLTGCSPTFEAALGLRRREHAARPPGGPLFATQCATLVTAAADGGGDAVAVWEPLSGHAREPIALQPRSADPIPATTAGGTHIVLRPLAFSPL